MHCVLSLFCDGRVVEIFILRLVHLESGIFMMVSCVFFFRLGLLIIVGMASLWLFLMESLLSANICRWDLVKSGPIGVIEFGVMNGCREVFVVIPWGSGPGIDVRLFLKSLDGKRGLGNCINGGRLKNIRLP